MAKKRAAGEGGQTKSAAIEAYLTEHQGASGREVVEALAAQGVSVSNSAVSLIRKKLSGGESSGSEASEPSENGAASGGANKSEAIRAYMKEHPEARNKDILAALREQGIDVAVTLISNIRSNLKKKSGAPAKRGRKPKAAAAAAPSAPAAKPAAASSGKGVTIEQVLAAKSLVDTLGGLAAAKKVIDLLEQLSR